MLSVFILGMHRSGTSVTAEIINKLGFEAGSDLLPANKNNPRGYFENRYIYLLNKKIMKDYASNWDNVEYSFFDNIYDDLYDKYSEEAKKIIKNEFSDSNNFFIKDPRICNLFPFWERVLDGKRKIKIVIPLRNPIEVAKSLKTRNHFSINKGLILWINHFINAERYSRKYERIFIKYDDLLNNSEITIESLIKFLDIQGSEINKDELYSVIDRSLKHNKVAFNEILEVFPILDKILKVIKNNKLNDFQLLDDIYKEYNEIISFVYENDIINTLPYVLNNTNELSYFRKKTLTLTQQIEELKSLLNDKNNEIELLKQKLDDKLEKSKHIGSSDINEKY